MATVIILAVLVLLESFIGIEMVNTPPTKRWHKWAYRIIFILLGLGVCYLTCLQYKQAGKEAEKSNQQIQAMTKQNQDLANNQTNALKKIDTIQSELSLAQETQQSIEMMLATNPAYDPNLRERIIASHKNIADLDIRAGDLTAWAKQIKSRSEDRRALSQIKHEKDLKAQQDYYEQNMPYFEDAMTSLTNLIVTVAEQLKDTADIKYEGIPVSIGPEIGDTNLAKIKFQKNTDWIFEVSFGSRGGSEGRRPLKINCKGGDLDLWISPAGAETHLSLYGEEPSAKVIPLVDFKKEINGCLKDLIGQEYNLTTSTNK